MALPLSKHKNTGEYPTQPPTTEEPTNLPTGQPIRQDVRLDDNRGIKKVETGLVRGYLGQNSKLYKILEALKHTFPSFSSSFWNKLLIFDQTLLIKV